MKSLNEWNSIILADKNTRAVLVMQCLCCYGTKVTDVRNKKNLLNNKFTLSPTSPWMQRINFIDFNAFHLFIPDNKIREFLIDDYHAGNKMKNSRPEMPELVIWCEYKRRKGESFIRRVTFMSWVAHKVKALQVCLYIYKYTHSYL